MNRFPRPLAVLALSATLMSACGGTPASVTPSVAATQRTGGAVAQLCDAESPASLEGVTADLEQTGPDSDVSDVSEQIAMARTNIESADIEGASEPTRQAAARAIRELESVLSDPSAREAVMSSAIDALRALDDEICAG